MTSLNRMLSVLDLFTAARPVWEADHIVDALGCSTPTGYRYLRELMQAGLLQRLNGGYYALGPRITLLDYVIRTTDPLLAASIPLMRELVAQTQCHCVLFRLDGDVFLELHHEQAGHDAPLVYGRGCPCPMFLGSAPKVAIASQTPKQQRGLYARFSADIAAAGLGDTEAAFLTAMHQIRKAGFARSDEEIEPGVSSLSVSVRSSPKEHCAALTLVAPVGSNIEQWRPLLKRVAQRICEKQAELGH